MIKKIDYIRCPVCGVTRPIGRIGKEYDLIVSTQSFIQGKKGCTWKIKYSGYNALKKAIVPVLEKLLFKLNELNGCDYWSDCLSCVRDLSECPNEVQRLDQKTTRKLRADRAAKLLSEGATTAEVAKVLGKSERTLRRYVRGK